MKLLLLFGVMVLVAWGRASAGGDSSAVQDQMQALLLPPSLAMVLSWPGVILHLAVTVVLCRLN